MWSILLKTLDLIADIVIFILKLIFLPPFIILKFLVIFIGQPWNEAVKMLRSEIKSQQAALEQSLRTIRGIFRIIVSLTYLVVTGVVYVAVLLLRITVYPLRKMWWWILEIFRNCLGILGAFLLLLFYCAMLFLLVTALIPAQNMRGEEMDSDNRRVKWG